jgi:putative glutamine amidotransferase
VGLQHYQMVGDKYVRAIAEAADAIPLIVPAVGAGVDLQAILRRIDGLLFTGSPSNIEPRHYAGDSSASDTLEDPFRDATTLALLPLAVEDGMPVLGICRGFQEMNVAFGGSLLQAVHDQLGYLDHREDLSASLEEQYAPAHDVVLEPGGLLRRLAGCERIRVNSLHRQGIDRLAPSLEVEARSPDGLIEAVRVRDASGFALAVQWHPEWQAQHNDFSRALFAEFRAACCLQRGPGAET